MKTPLRGVYARVLLFSKDENGTFSKKPTSSRFMKVRVNAAIPPSHKMLK